VTTPKGKFHVRSVKLFGGKSNIANMILN
jgi:hypothetical protein